MLVGWWSIDNDCGIVDAATSMQPAHVSSARCGSSPPFVRTTVAALGLVVAALSVAHAESVDFSREIQPLLAKRCFSCHGPDTQEGGLRLDDAATATRELDSGTRAIVPGDEAASALLERITSTDPDLQMPPEGSRLTAAQVGAIRRWIAAGAEFPHAADVRRGCQADRRLHPRRPRPAWPSRAIPRRQAVAPAARYLRRHRPAASRAGDARLSRR